MEKRVSRRRLLALGAAALGGATAGCTGEGREMDSPDALANDRAGGSHSSSDSAGQSAAALVWERELPGAPFKLRAGPADSAIVGHCRHGLSAFGYGPDGTARWIRPAEVNEIVGVGGSYVYELEHRFEADTLRAISPATGDIAWSHEIDDEWFPDEVAVCDGQCVIFEVDDYDGSGEERSARLVSIGQREGAVRWRTSLPVEGTTVRYQWNLAPLGQNVLARGIYRDLRSYSPSGTLAWERRLPDETTVTDDSETARGVGYSGDAYDGTSYYLGVSRSQFRDGQQIVAIDLDSGQIRWHRTAPVPVLGTDGERVYCESWDTSTITALDAESGNRRWTDDGSGHVLTDRVVAGPTAVWLPSRLLGVELRALDPATGGTIGTHSLPGNRITAPVVTEDPVYVATGRLRDRVDDEPGGEGTLQALDRQDLLGEGA